MKLPRLHVDDCKLLQTCLRLCGCTGLSSTSPNTYRLTFLLLLAATCVFVTVSHDYASLMNYGVLLWTFRAPWTYLLLANGLLAILGAQYFGRARRWWRFYRSLRRMGSRSRPFGYKSRLKSYQAYGCFVTMFVVQTIYKGYSQYLHYKRMGHQDLAFVAVVAVMGAYGCLVNYFTFLTAYCLRERFDVVTGKLVIGKYGDMSRFLIACNEVCESFDSVLGMKLFLNAFVCVADAVLVMAGTVVTRVPPTSVHVGQLAAQMGVLFIVILECDGAERSGRKFCEACYKLLGERPGARNERLLSLGRVSGRLRPKLSAGGFFVVDRSVVLSLLYAFLTYVITVFQISGAMAA